MLAPQTPKGFDLEHPEDDTGVDVARHVDPAALPPILTVAKANQLKRFTSMDVRKTSGSTASEPMRRFPSSPAAAETSSQKCVQGGYFGEGALLNSIPRAATVTASSMLKCYTLTKRDFIRHVPSSMFEDDAVRGGLLREVPLFSQLSDTALDKVLACAKSVTYATGSAIITEGDEGNCMFVLLDGGADVEVGGKAVHHYSRGGYFGELSLIQNAPRTATVRASCDTTCMVLDKPTLEAQGGGDFALLYVRHFIRSVPLLKGMDGKDVDSVAKALQISYYHEGQAIIKEGEQGDAIYFLVTGLAHVVRGSSKVLHAFYPGQYFGELALMDDVARSATILAAETSMCFVLHRRDVVAKTMHKLDACRYLSSVPILQSMKDEELLNIANVLLVRFYTEGDEIFRQGDIGDKLYLIREGTASASIDGVCVKRYSKGDYFGEVGLLSNSERAATLTATSTLKCYTLCQQSFVRHIPAHLFESEHVMQIRKGLQSSKEVIAITARYWRIEDFRGNVEHTGQITRPLYEQLHLRLNKALSATFDLADATTAANSDWAEDIAAFSGVSKDKIWLQEVKIKLAQLGGLRSSASVKAVFEKYDADRSLGLECDEFVLAIRAECNITEAVVSDEQLEQLFKLVDNDNNGVITATELGELLGSGQVVAGGMDVDNFSHSMFQLADLWTAKISKHQYSMFLTRLFDRITEVRFLVLHEYSALLPRVDEERTLVVYFVCLFRIFHALGPCNATAR